MSKNKQRRKTVIYARYSSNNQKETSIDDQVAICKKRAYEQGLTVDDVYSDSALSGKDTDRPSYQKLAKDIEKGIIENVLVYKVDRLNRNVIDALKLFELADYKETQIISVTENIDNSESGRFMRVIYFAVAQKQSDDLSKIVRRGKASNVTRGEYNGGTVPYGYTVNTESNKFEIVKQEAEVVKLIFDLYKNGKGYKNIAKILHEKGYANRNEKLYSTETISSMLRNEKYKGLTFSGKLKKSNTKIKRK